MLTHFVGSAVIVCLTRDRGGGFELHHRHCVVSLSITHLSLLSTDSMQEDPFDITERLLTEMYITKSNKQKLILLVLSCYCSYG